MKKTILSAMTVLSGLSLCATGFDGKQFQTNDWFDVSFSGGAVVVNPESSGSWNETPTVSGSVMDLDTEDPVTFTPAPFSVTSGYETVVANIKAEVTDGDLISFTEPVQAAFCIQVDGSTFKAMGHTQNGWTNISYTAASTDYTVANLTNVWFTLYMDFAKEGVGSRSVRYSVKRDGDLSATVLTDSAGESWFQTANKETIESISFTGSGKVMTFSADELDEIVPVTFSDVEFTYLTSYATATTVVATVTGNVKSGTTFTLNFGGTEYNNGEYANGKVTFYNVGGGNLNLGDSVSYTITASGMATGTTDSQTTTVGTTRGGWINEDASNSGSGTWSNSTDQVTLTYSGSPAAAELSDYLFTPTNAVGDAVVTVVSTVCFGDVADTTSDNPGTDAYAAIRIADNSGSTFQIWAKTAENGEAEWIDVENASVAVDPASTNAVKSVFDFVQGTCQFYVGENALASKSNSQTNFFLAGNVRKMSKVNFSGTGTLTSLVGSYVEGEKIVETVDATGIVVDSKWVADKLGDKTFEEAGNLLSPSSAVKTTHAGKKYNYFECYALGINPANSEEAPVVSAAPAGNGIKMSLAGINVPEGVTLTVKLLQKGDDDTDYSDAGKTATVVGGSTAGDITIGTIPDGVMRYKMDIDIGATAP